MTTIQTRPHAHQRLCAELGEVQHRLTKARTLYRQTLDDAAGIDVDELMRRADGIALELAAVLS